MTQDKREAAERDKIALTATLMNAPQDLQDAVIIRHARYIWDAAINHANTATADLQRQVEAMRGQVREWVPVTERLPVSSDRQALCIVTVEWSDGSGSVGLAGYWNEGGWSIEVKKPGDTLTAKVTAWMLRPEPFTTPTNAETTDAQS